MRLNRTVLSSPPRTWLRASRPRSAHRFTPSRERRARRPDLLSVHHRSWPEIELKLVEENHKRLRQNGISLYGAHSALDCALAISNGYGIAEATGVKVRERFIPYHGGMAGVIGTTIGIFQQLADRLRSALRTLVEARENTDRFGVVAIVSGGGKLTSWVQEAPPEALTPT